jgi:hypothetical protein
MTRSEIFIAEIARRAGARWPAIEKSLQASRERRDQLERLLTDLRADSSDLSVVALGSLGRNEWTSGSDLDWTLLVDGQANSDHLLVAQSIRNALEEAGFKRPGQTGIFGNMAFSHELVHNIGGQDDTNRNTTQRILLLLESTTLGPNTEAYRRVIAAIANRYLEEDASLPRTSGKPHYVPRFLLNDIVRFWRTMTVDFASKQRDRGGAGWGLRNAKLRMSRKLIFASGLLMCFLCHESGLEWEEVSPNDDSPQLPYLIALAGRTPLELLAEALVRYDVENAAGPKMFGAYDEFLAVIDDSEKRKALEGLHPQDAGSDPVFENVRAISKQFQAGLMEFFFENGAIGPLTLQYGVF